ncbi:MAG: O-antigen ligase family protein [Betaproteobacteria bacterium]|nr:O-antigen ligase family protein [Betaproteobacteria bacterium]
MGNRRREFNPEKALYWALLALLVWLPVPLGSNRGWAWAVMEVSAFALLAWWLVLWATDKITIEDPLRKAWPVFALLGLYGLVVAVDSVPMPREWVEVLSPASARTWAVTDILGIKRDWITLSIEPHISRVALMKSLAYGAIFFLFLAVVNNRQRVMTAARVLVFAAVLHAIYAVLMHLSGVSDEHYGTLIMHGESASGFYANRNHFAGMLEMTLAIGIGLLIAGLSDRVAGTWKAFFRHLIEWILSPKMLLRLSLCILVIALTTTHSRMGNTAFFSALLIAGVIGIALSRHATRNTVILLVSLVVLDLTIVGSWFGVEKLAKRLEATTMQDVQEREDPAAYTVPMIKDFPLFGTGPGTFYVAFLKYKPEKVVGFYDYTHNDYAQIASETGLVGLGLLGGVVLLTLVVALRAQWIRRDPLMRGMSFACIMGVTSLLIHSWVDFNLQIPANAAYFMVLLAFGWISLFLDRRVA